MKAIAIESFGGVEKLKVTDVATPKPADNEVQIEILYTAVNPVDWKIREGMLKDRLPHEFPLIPGWDAAGIIKAVGSNVKNFRPGDEVFAYCRKPVVKMGTYAEFICLPAEQVAIKPKNINFAQAAAIPLVGLTAWQALFDAAHLKKGETVLIHAGAGGVGSLAIELAKNAGAVVITTARKSNHPYVQKLGADVVIDYTTENFVDVIKKRHPDGIDIVLECMGGQILKDSYQVLKSGGRLVSITEGIDKDLAKQHNVQATYVFVKPSGAQLKEIADLIVAGKVVAPNIEEMKLDQAAEAQEKVRQGHTRGKIVLKVKASGDGH